MRKIGWEVHKHCKEMNYHDEGAHKVEKFNVVFKLYARFYCLDVVLYHLHSAIIKHNRHKVQNKKSMIWRWTDYRCDA